MKLKGYFITHETSKGMKKIIDRIKDVGIQYYERHDFLPIYIINIEGKKGIFIVTDSEIKDVFNLLAFSFSGLVDDEDKVTEIERYGKYRCIVKFYDELLVDKNYVNQFEF